MGKKKFPELVPFTEKVRKTIGPAKIILFGSRAEGRAHKDSDYDIIIISEKFLNVNFIERPASMFRLKRGLGLAMDIICYTPEEFEEMVSEPSFVQDAVKTGIEI